MEVIVKLCACGCGEPITSKYPDTRFIHNHHRRGVPNPASPERRKRISEALTGRKLPEEQIKAMSEKRRGIKQGPRSEEFRKKMVAVAAGRVVSLEQRKKVSESVKKRWADGTYDKAFPKSSKMEAKLAPVVKELGFHNTLERNFYVVSNGRTKIPDFFDRKNKKVIELFGTYWHRDLVFPDGRFHETPEELIDWYRRAGWECEVIWEDEFEEFYESCVSKLAVRV